MKNTSTYTVIVLVYVDDILIIGSDNSVISQLVTCLNKEFAPNDLGKLPWYSS